MSIFLILATLWNSTQQIEVQLLGKTSISGTASDLSSMENLLEDKSPNNRLGALALQSLTPDRETSIFYYPIEAQVMEPIPIHADFI